ncbi:Major facilitator superfamily domain-containing protein 6 [Anthophora plagiata]
MSITASTERMDTSKDLPKKNFINTNLLSLKLLLFLFFGGLGCLFPFLPLHMTKMGLSIEQIRLISMISPAVAILGPVIAAPIADKLAGHQGRSDKSSTGRYLRVMIAIACILSAIFYAFLILIPTANRIEPPRERRPGLKFSCDQTGAVVLQERCKDRITCHRWSDKTRVGLLLLESCNYACYPIGLRRWHSENNDGSTTSETIDTDFGVLDGSGDTTVIPLESKMYAQVNIEDQEETKKLRRFAMPDSEPPHLCFKEGDNVVCHVYTKYSDNLAINATLGQALNNERDQDWCAYPLTEYFTCRIPPELEIGMADAYQSCSIECDLVDPYTLPDSVFADSQCQQTKDWSHLVFWTYLAIRSTADIFPTTAVALIDAAVVIATRETSCGRGDVGRQLAFGSLGFAIFGPLTGYLCTLIENLNSFYYLPIGMHAAMMLLAALVALCANGMPLSPPEWWWHTRSGMLALPMSAIKRYGSETAALVIVLIVMGTFWSAMDSYLPLHLQKLGGDELPIGVAMTVGAVPAFLFLWKSEHLVDYCGHSNLLITAFTVYIIRFTGLSLVAEPWWSLISEALEVFTLGIMWVTAILYLRHLVPRHLTVTAQALPVIAHFCVGRCIGAVIGAYINVDEGNIVDSLRFVYRCMAVAAAAVAALYFVLYHGLLKPRCHAHTIQGPRQPPTVVQAAIKEYELTMNGNGNYTPLRVYHNGMGRKGQFRY